MRLLVFLLLLLASPAAAKINLSGAMFATYWAQQEGLDSFQVATATGWQDAPVQVTGPLYRGRLPTTRKKTFLLHNSIIGTATQAPLDAGYGVLFNLDCPVSDNTRVFAMLALRNGATTIMPRALWGEYAFSPALKLRAGRFLQPFGLEPASRWGEHFISEYTQDGRGSLQAIYDQGIMALGTSAGGMVDYRLYAGNGAVTTVGDSLNYAISAAPGASTAYLLLGNSTATPDIDDAKQVIGSLTLRPLPGLMLGGGYATGDYTNLNTVNGACVQRARFSAVNAHASYERAGAFRVSGEYAGTRHDRMSLESDAGVTGAPAVRTQLVASRVNEFILKAFYLGIPDWMLGVRATVVDPKNFEAELAAGYSRETKLSAAVAWRITGKYQFCVEYSRIVTDLDYLNAYDPAAVAGSYRINPAADFDDDFVTAQFAALF